LEFTILTAGRTNEVLGARWDEINLPERLWTIPASRMKSGKEHRVPLSDRAIAILAEMEGRGGNLVFGRALDQKLDHTALRRQLARMGREETVHGFRSSFVQWAAERTRYTFEEREMVLAHRVGDAVVRAYQRSDLFD